MRKTDIPEVTNRYDKSGGQEWHLQFVRTPWGEVRIFGNTRVPKLSASKQQWNIWFRRFVESRGDVNLLDQRTRETYTNWKNR